MNRHGDICENTRYYFVSVRFYYPYVREEPVLYVTVTFTITVEHPGTASGCGINTRRDWFSQLDGNMTVPVPLLVVHDVDSSIFVFLVISVRVGSRERHRRFLFVVALFYMM